MLEPAADTPHHSRTPQERRLLPMRRPSMKHEPTATSAAWRTQAASPRLRLSPDQASAGAPALACHSAAGLALEAIAGTSHHGRQLKKGGSSLVQRPFATPKPRTTCAARRGARAQPARVLRLLPRDSLRRCACVCLTSGHRSRLEAAARTSHNGVAPKETDLSPVQRPFMGLNPSQPARRGAHAQ